MGTSMEYDDTFIESSSIYIIMNESGISDKYRTGINTLVGPSIHWLFDHGCVSAGWHS